MPRKYEYIDPTGGSVDPIEDNAWQMIVAFLLFLELGWWKGILAYIFAYLAARGLRALSNWIRTHYHKEDFYG
jgi:hypothetical protein